MKPKCALQITTHWRGESGYDYTSNQEREGWVGVEVLLRHAGEDCREKFKRCHLKYSVQWDNGEGVKPGRDLAESRERGVGFSLGQDWRTGTSTVHLSERLETLSILVPHRRGGGCCCKSQNSSRLAKRVRPCCPWMLITSQLEAKKAKLIPDLSRMATSPGLQCDTVLDQHRDTWY